MPNVHRRRAVHGIVVIGLILPATPARSTDDTPRVLDMDIPRVMSPSRLPQRLDESPSSVTLIDREMIAASGARHLVDLLRLVPGFQVGFKDNQLPSAAFHGLSDEFARRTLLLVDGQRIFQYSRGVIEWNNIPLQLEDIDRIEVIRGPNAAAYGSNAYQAVINIQTRTPAEQTGLQLSGAVGSDGIGDGFARYGGRAGALDYVLSVYSKSDGGYHDVPDDRRNQGITLRGELPLDSYGSLLLRAGYASGEYQALNDGSLPSEPGDRWRRTAITDNYQSLEWRTMLTDGSEISATFAHNRLDFDDPGYRNRERVPGLTLNVQFDIEEERYDAEFQFSKMISDQFRYLAGAGYHREEIISPYFFATDATLDNSVFRLFGHGEYRFSEDFVLNFGAMLESSEIAGRDWLFLPRLAVHYHPAAAHTLRAIVSTGSRQPTLYENQGLAIVRALEAPLTVYRVIATGHERGGLDPETIVSFELGYQWLPAKDKSLDIRVFYERLSNLISQFRRPGPPVPLPVANALVLDFANDETISVRGVEAQFGWHNDSGFGVFASYAYTNIDTHGTRFDNGYEDSAPRHGAGLLLSQTFGHGWMASLNYDYQSAMRWYFDEPIDEYHKLDARIAKRFQLGTGEATVELIGTNLLDSVSDFQPDRAWERGVFVRLGIDF